MSAESRELAGLTPNALTFPGPSSVCARLALPDRAISIVKVSLRIHFFCISLSFCIVPVVFVFDWGLVSLKKLLLPLVDNQ